MSDLLWQGLTLSLMGITLTFAALGLVIAVVFVLQRVFGAQPLAGTLARDTEDEEIVAAIASALAHLRALAICRRRLGASLEAGRGSWWAMGRLRQHSGARPRAGRRGPA